MTEEWTDELLAQKLVDNPDLKVVVPLNGNAPQQARDRVIPRTGSQHPERDLEQFVHDTARTFGLLYYHTYKSKFSEPGYPDCNIIGRYQIVAELKNTGKHPTPAQQMWLDAFKAIGVPAFVWRPADKDSILKILSEMRTRQVKEAR